MENRTVDARGMACPLPVVNAKKASEEMTEGGVLTILVDNEIASTKPYQIWNQPKLPGFFREKRGKRI